MFYDSNYLQDATHEYAHQHALREYQEGEPCQCSNGWRLTPMDCWVQCPACPTGQHPEYDDHEDYEEEHPETLLEKETSHVES